MLIFLALISSVCADFVEVEVVQNQLQNLGSTFNKLYADTIEESEQIIESKIKEGKDANARGCIDEMGREAMARIDEAAQVYLEVIQECESHVKCLQNDPASLKSLQTKLKLNSDYDKYLQKAIYSTQQSRYKFINDFLTRSKKCF